MNIEQAWQELLEKRMIARHRRITRKCGLITRKELAGYIENHSEWQPIETVPRDGTQSFLGIYQSGHIEHLYLTTPVPPLVQTFRYFGGKMAGQQAGWPVCWMPTPKRHAEQEKESPWNFRSRNQTRLL